MKMTERKVIKIQGAGRKNVKSNTTTAQVCAYCRVSTETSSQHSSYLSQIGYYTDYIQKNGDWEFVGIFSDESSGTKMQTRDGFQEMMIECRKGNVDIILSKSITRFARNTVDSLTAIRELRSLGVSVRFQKENIDTSAEESEQLLTILSGVAQLESNNISENVKWGKRKRFQDGTAKIGIPPYGYKKISDGTVEIDESVEEVVRFIIQKGMDGLGTHHIVKLLMERNIPTPKNVEQWSAIMIGNILYNPFYKGDVIFQKSFMPDVMGGKVSLNHGELPKYYIENHHVAYISEADWNTIQSNKEFREKGRKPFQQHYRDELSGRIFCGVCGKTMRRSASGLKVRYSCKLHVHHKCPMKRMPATTLHMQFVEMWNRLVQCKEWILVPLLADLQMASQLESKQELQVILKEIKSLEMEKDALLQRMAKNELEYEMFLQQSHELQLQLARSK